jgi:hypothetical protein
MQEMAMKIQGQQQQLAMKLQATRAQTDANVEATRATTDAKVQQTHMQSAVQADVAKKQMELQGQQHDAGMTQAKEGHKLKLQTMQEQAAAKRAEARRPVSKAKAKK